MKIDTVTYTGLEIDSTTRQITSTTAGSRTYDWDNSTGFLSTTDVDALKDDPATLSTYDTGYLTIAPADSFQLGTSDFTIEAWAYLEEDLFGTGTIISQRFNSVTELSFELKYSTNNLYLTINDGANIFSFTDYTLTAGQWQHVAVVRYNDTLTAYADGVPHITTHDMSADDIQYSDELIYIGAANDGGISNPPEDPFIGYMQDVRLLKSAAYDGEFTPTALTFGGGQVYGDPHIVTLGGKKYTL